ncbi:3-keto-5-aminohexanoate cleavage protein [Parasalinivibrio latis]|uniref:3-keto-5-aminohexanoate cleavage protein n=1 Tax=Parasalinivibrio latis TaxID=2952610 RepID=UPI0030E5D30F
MKTDRNIIVAPNGARPGTSDHPAVPVTVNTLIDELALCAHAGAAMAHIHVRDSEQKHSLDPALNKEWLAEVRSALDNKLVIQLTTEAVGRYSPAQQMALLRATLPEATSIALREIMPDEGSVDAASLFLHEVSEQRIFIQYILYGAHDVIRYRQLISQGKIPSAGHHLLLVLGRYNESFIAQPAELDPMLSALTGSETPWAACAFGPYAFQCLQSANLLGGDIRIGFENGLTDQSGKIASNNAQLVSQIGNSVINTGFSLNSATDLRRKIHKSFK